MNFARVQKICSWVGLTFSVIAILIAAVACLGTRFGVLPYARGQEVLIGGIGAGIVGLGFAGVWLWRALKENNGISGRVGMAGLILSLIVVGIPGHYAWRYFQYPAIHDISTDIGDAPVFRLPEGARKGATNPPDYDGQKPIMLDGEQVTVAVAQKDAFRAIKSIECLAGNTPQGAYVTKYFWRSLNAVNTLGWDVMGFDIKSGTIEAASSSLWFGVVSDIAIRVRPAGTIGVSVDIRAKSREGQTDFGRNAALVTEFKQIVRCR